MEDVAVDRTGLVITECQDLMQVVAGERGATLREIRGTLGSEGVESEEMYALLKQRSIMEGEKKGLCSLRLYPLDHPECRIALDGHPCCMESWESRNFFYLHRLQSEKDGVAAKAPWMRTEALDAKQRKYRVGSHLIGDGCATDVTEAFFDSEPPRVLWALAATKQAIDRVDASQPKGSPVLSWSYKLLNIGAADGGENDPLHPLLQRNYSGVWVEADSKHIATLRANLAKSRGHTVLQKVATPDSTTQLLEMANLSSPYMRVASLDILKVDIDSYDCDIVRALLQDGLSPKLVWIEVNWSIPPPLMYARHYTRGRQDIVAARIPFHGCSLSYAVRMMHALGYSFIAVDGSDAVFMHSFLAAQLHDKAGEVEVPDYGRSHCIAVSPLDEFHVYRKRKHLPVFAPVEWIREWFFVLHPHEALEAVWRNLTLFASGFGQDHVPFTLDL